MTAGNSKKSKAIQFIILFGVISLFADATYEGARSVTGPFLGTLGASGFLVGMIAGLGELLGYAIRFPAGLLSDKTGRHWLLTIIGYFINLLAVPLLALAGSWQSAAFLMILERAGRGLRNPPRDAMLSYASREIGRGWSFGLHEALDQIGAVLGPLILTAVFYFKGTYRHGFAILAIPAFLAIITLLMTRRLYPSPRSMEAVGPVNRRGFPKVFWIYLAAVGLVAAGYADYSLIAYHFSKQPSLQEWIPVFYAIAMAVDALAALIFGYLFDRAGIVILIAAVIISTLFAPFVFWGGFGLVLVGVVLWGIGMGAQESIMRAAVADMIPADKRATAYGIFNAGFGLFWFLGSALIGYLYDISLGKVVAFSVGIQLLSIPLFVMTARKWQKPG